MLTAGLGCDHADSAGDKHMRFDAHVSRGGLWMDPVLPESYGDLHVTNVPMAGGRISIVVVDSIASVQGLPEGMVFHRRHRPWLTELVKEARLHRKT